MRRPGDLPFRKLPVQRFIDLPGAAAYTACQVAHLAALPEDLEAILHVQFETLLYGALVTRAVVLELGSGTRFALDWGRGPVDRTTGQPTTTAVVLDINSDDWERRLDEVLAATNLAVKVIWRMDSDTREHVLAFAREGTSS